MVINVKMISKEIIKPSPPITHKFTNLKLSFLDQMAPPSYVPVIFFYKHDGLTNNPEVDRVEKLSSLLKQSLSAVLTVFYPLVGKIQEKSFVDICHDSGAEFIVTQVEARIFRVTKDPNVEELKKLLPAENCGENSRLLSVQINFFSDGISVAVCLSHKIADAQSLVTFMNAWAAKCSAVEAEIFPPGFNLATHFQPRDLSALPSPLANGIPPKIVTKRFVFHKEQLATLKEAAATETGSLVTDPTRVEVVTAFIWKHFMAVTKHKSVAKKKFAAMHAVNVRPRISPSTLLQHEFGNSVIYPLAFSEGDREFHELVNGIRKAKVKISGDYIRKLQQGEDDYLNDLKEAGNLIFKGEMEFCNFSSWCRFPLYEVDFGWGKPTWVCTTNLPFVNMVILMSTCDGSGIEAWVNMLEEDMEIIQSRIPNSSFQLLEI